MERWEKPSHRRGGGGRNNPSFSSSLLDAIYRSIDEPDGVSAAAKEDKHTGGAPDPFLSPKTTFKKQSAAAFAKTTRPNSASPAAEKQALRRKQELHRDDRRHHYDSYHRNRGFVTSTSSSSGGSSFGGFSSSDAESSRSRPIRSSAAPLRPERIRSDLSPLHQEKKPGSIRGRFRDLRKARAGSAPSSPGARLASFLNALFSGAGSPKKAKDAPQAAASGAEESACSSASSYTRSCLSKTPSSGGRSKLSVRFGPVSVGAEYGTCGGGGKSFYKEERDSAEARDGRRMMEELLRGLEAVSDDEGGAESDASSDLFELENLAVDVRGGGYRDELPVYETTHLATNRAIAHGLL